MSEFAKVGNGSRIVSASGRFLVRKASKVNRLSVNRDSSHECISHGSLENTLIACAVIAILTSVCSVLRLGAFPQIGTAVIECVLIAMVVTYSSHNLILHVDATHVFPSHSVVSFRPGIEGRVPYPLRKIFVITGINSSVEPHSQGDELNSIVFRLYDEVTSFSHVGHRNMERTV